MLSRFDIARALVCLASLDRESIRQCTASHRLSRVSIPWMTSGKPEKPCRCHATRLCIFCPRIALMKSQHLIGATRESLDPISFTTQPPLILAFRAALVRSSGRNLNSFGIIWTELVARQTLPAFHWQERETTQIPEEKNILRTKCFWSRQSSSYNACKGELSQRRS